MNAVANGEMDILQLLLDILAETRSAYCVIGGLAVNAYAEPVVSLDLDIVVASDDIGKVVSAAEGQGLKIERFEHSIKLTSAKSDLRIQLLYGGPLSSVHSSVKREGNTRLPNAGGGRYGCASGKDLGVSG